MAKSNNNLKAVLQDTANAIRNKAGTSALIEPRDFADEITNLPSGGENHEADLIQGTFRGVYTNNEVSAVRDYVFQSMSSLTAVNLSHCLRLGVGAFKDCINLSQVSLPLCSSISGSTS